MSDYNNSKTVQVLRAEYYFLDVYISKLEKDNQDLVKRHIELENSLIELRKKVGYFGVGLLLLLAHWVIMSR